MKKMFSLSRMTVISSLVVSSLLFISTGAPAFQKAKPPAKKPPTKTPAKSPAKPTQTKTTPKPAPKSEAKTESQQTSTTTIDVTAPDALDQIRALTSQQERINALEKLIVTQRGSVVQEGRTLLIREYSLRGEQHLREGSAPLAAKDFRAVFRLIPDPVTDRMFDQFVFPMPIALGAFGFRVEAVELMKSFEKRFASDANRLVQVGFFYVQIEAPLEAVRVMEQAAKLAPDDHRVHNGLGNAYLINLRLNDALAEYEKALDLNPRDEFANLSLANLLRGMGENERAIEFYRKHLAIKKEDAEAHGGMAMAMLALGQDSQAERELQLAMQYDSNNYSILIQQAFFHLSRRKPAVARPFIERAARLAPRYAWAHIAKANADALESKYGDALATAIGAQELGNFPTLTFELVKMLMNVDGYDQALEVMKRSFTVTNEGEFETLLGGVAKARSQRLDILIERERQASLFLNEGLTTALQFRLAEALAKIDKYIQVAAAAKKQATAPKRTTAKTPAKGAAANKKAEETTAATRPRRTSAEPLATNAPLSAGADANLAGMDELLKAITTFTTLDDGRQSFRMVWVAKKLTEAGVALDAAEQLARHALEMAEAATEPENSMRDAPLLDRQGRRAVFLGRAYDALGWTLFKKGSTRAAIAALTKSVENYLPSPERKSALWHLAVATEEAGDDRNALAFYIASYEPSSPTADIRRRQIETLYVKVNGSKDGLEEKLRQP